MGARSRRGPSMRRAICLPLATNTSLGQIVNARTLESQVSRLLSSEFSEVRDLGYKLRTAATEPAWNVQRDKLEELAGEGRRRTPWRPTRSCAT